MIEAAIIMQHTAQIVTMIIAAFAPAERPLSVAKPQNPEKSASVNFF